MTSGSTSIGEGLADVPVVPSVVTIGVFDGVHRGHRVLLARAVERAQSDGLRSVAVTFDRNPLAVVRPDDAPPSLQALDDKVAALLATGINHVHVLVFDAEAAQEDPRDFADRVLAGPLAARHVIVGENFRFGHRAAGDVALLREVGPDLAFTVAGVELVDHDGQVVSSSAIRAAIAAGDVAHAADLLGRPHRLSGRVVPGEGRGRTIGVPTANVAVVDGLALPATGVYATRVARRALDGVTGPTGEEWPAVTNIGTRPTFDGRGVTVEAHLLDVEVDLYGREVVVDLVARLRGERRFDGVDALVAQIRTDIGDARQLLAPSDTT